MHEAVPGVSVGATAVIWVAVAVTTFWLGIAGTVWKVFLEPAMERLRKDHEEERASCTARIAKMEVAHATETERMNNRITMLETMLMTYGPMSLRAQMQTVRSAEQIAGIADHEGDDTTGVHAHRIPRTDR